MASARLYSACSSSCARQRRTSLPCTRIADAWPAGCHSELQDCPDTSRSEHSRVETLGLPFSAAPAVARLGHGLKVAASS